ncbi:hypothetical protein NC652_006637 [Populus alba x Populus x berolinensis]|nr:hypothetical protein NC652_006637 [Populus alba x Populus x berolinensis]
MNMLTFRNHSADMLAQETELDNNKKEKGVNFPCRSILETGIFKIVDPGNIFRYVSSSLIEEPCKSSHLAALDVANKKAGCLLCYDPNLRPPPWPSEEAAERNREHME